VIRCREKKRQQRRGHEGIWFAFHHDAWSKRGTASAANGGKFWRKWRRCDNPTKEFTGRHENPMSRNENPGRFLAVGGAKDHDSNPIWPWPSQYALNCEHAAI
jgi:hypothetical protein